MNSFKNKNDSSINDIIFGPGPNDINLPMLITFHSTRNDHSKKFGPRIYSMPFPKKRAQKIYDELTKDDNAILLKMSTITRTFPWPSEGTMNIDQIIREPLFKLSLVVKTCKS